MLGRLLRIGLKVTVFWICWWLFAAVGTQLALPGFLRYLDDKGISAQADITGFSGFPASFHIEFEDLTVASPRDGFLWRTPDLQVQTPSWNPLRATLTWPRTFTVATRGLGRVNGRVDVMETTIALRAGLPARFGGTSASIRNGLFTSNQGLRSAVDAADISIWSAIGSEDQFTITVDAEGLEPTRELRLLIDRSRRLPQKIDRIIADLDVAFDRPFLLSEVTGPEPRLTALDIRRLDVAWGVVGFGAEGQLSVDAFGIPAGRLDMTARNWRELLRLASSAELLPAENHRAVEQAIAALTAGAENPDSVTVPILFRDGQMTVGPLPVGATPVLR